MKLKMSYECHHKIGERKLNVKQKIQDLIGKYQKKEIFPQKEGSELLISFD